jgi:putative spermidine/putrescine transport system permease protein
VNPRISAAARTSLLGLAAAFLLAPLVVTAGVSFNGSSRMSFPPEDPGLRWYAAFLSDPSWTGSVEASLLVASLAALMSMSIAFPIAYAGWRHGGRAAQAMRAFGSLPFLLPAVVIAIVFLVFWTATGHGGRLEDTVVSHGIVFAALPIATLGMGFSSIDPALVQAARTMGARDSDVLRTVVLPIVRPYVVTGLIFVFVLSLNEYIVAYMVSGFNVQTLPIKVFNNLRMGFQPTMCVGAVLFTLIGVAAFTAIAAIGDLPKLLGAKT